MKTLIIHHLEPMWENGYNKFGTTCFDLCTGLTEFLEKNCFDQIILTQFEDWNPQPIHHETGLSDFITKYEEYSYGWERDCFRHENEFCEGGTHSEVVWLPDWLKGLRNHSVSLCGAFDGECIEDMEIALSHCVGNFSRIEEFIL